MNDATRNEVTRLERKLHDELAEIAQQKREVPKGSDSEIRQFGLTSRADSAERQLTALDEFKQGRR
jgi:hypothetical protein